MRYSALLGEKDIDSQMRQLYIEQSLQKDLHEKNHIVDDFS